MCIHVHTYAQRNEGIGSLHRVAEGESYMGLWIWGLSWCLACEKWNNSLCFRTTHFLSEWPLPKRILRIDAHIYWDLIITACFGLISNNSTHCKFQSEQALVRCLSVLDNWPMKGFNFPQYVLFVHSFLGPLYLVKLHTEVPHMVISLRGCLPYRCLQLTAEVLWGCIPDNPLHSNGFLRVFF